MSNIAGDIIKNNLLVDTHCHLHAEIFEGELDKVLAESEKEGLDEIWLVSIDEGSFLKNIEIIKIHQSHLPKLKLRLGLGFDMEALVPGSEIFSEELFNKSEEDLAKHIKDKLERLFAKAKDEELAVDLIGEIGMDFYWLEKNNVDNETKEHSKRLQRLLFTIQLDFAAQNNLPTCIHTRGAEDECIEIVSEHVQKYANFTPIFHSFTGSKDQMQKIIDFGGFIGVNGIVTYKSAEELKQAINALKMANNDHFLLETDAPYLIPANFDRNLLKKAYGQAINVPYTIKSLERA